MMESRGLKVVDGGLPFKCRFYPMCREELLMFLRTVGKMNIAVFEDDQFVSQGAGRWV